MNETDGREPVGSRSVGDRRWAIVEAIEQNRRLSVQQLKQRFGLSEVSIRRDLDYLARQGLIHRVHGGAEATARSAHAGIFEARLLRNGAVKRAVAREAVKLFSPGDRLLLDSGTTVLEVARALPPQLKEAGDLTVMTRSLSIATELRDARGLRLLVFGGLYASDYDTFVGAQVERALEDIHVDRLVIGADGVHPLRGLTSDNVLEVGLFRTMARCADQVIVVTDSTKIGANHLQSILGLDEIDVFVTDADAPPEVLRLLRDRGAEVLVADVAHEHNGSNAA